MGFGIDPPGVTGQEHRRLASRDPAANHCLLPAAEPRIQIGRGVDARFVVMERLQLRHTCEAAITEGQARKKVSYPACA